ncbi:MAG: DUF1292 domain-containing protein [Bacilli bacterium]
MEDTKYITIKGFDFIITKELDFNGSHYMIAIDEKGEDTIAVLKQKFVDGVEKVESVQDDDELEMIFELIKRENAVS